MTTGLVVRRPGFVVQLLGNESQDAAAAGKLLKPTDQLLSSNDPKHVEATQGIERHEPGLGGLAEG